MAKNKFCKKGHTYVNLDVEKRKVEHRFNTDYYRTTRLFCETCGKIKEIKDYVNIGIYEEERPEWTTSI